MEDKRVCGTFNQGFKLSEFSMGKRQCLHFDHDEGTVKLLNERYGMDHWEALRLIKEYRELYGFSHTCRKQPFACAAIKPEESVVSKELLTV